MKSFVHKHKHKIIAGHGIVIVFFLLTSILSMQKEEAVLFFTPYGEEILQLGDTDTVDININTSVPINAVGATISFPKDTLEIVTISKEKSFLDLWTEDTVVQENLGKMVFSGGSLKQGGLTGTGTALTLSIRAKKAGQATLSFENAQLIAADGKGTVVGSEIRSITYTIPEASPPPPSGGSTLGVPTPSIDLDGSGTVTIADVSIMMMRMWLPYDPRYDLDVDGGLGLSDLSILLSEL